MRFSMPLLTGRRGSGLANEAIPWAKAFIGAQELRLRSLHPAWGLNPRGYSRDFETSRLDVLAQLALRRTLPTVRITYELVQETGEVDYALALRALAPELGLRRAGPLVVTHESMDGGWKSIERAREFLLSEFLRPAHVARDLYRVRETLDPELLTIGVHLRFGDFERSKEGPTPGIYNRTLPDAWYEHVVTGLLDSFGERAQALIVTDGPDEPIVRSLLEHPRVHVPPARTRPVLSDLVSLVSADVLVCSVSAFSQLAAFLAGAPYVWFPGHLNDHGGWWSIWGHEQNEQAPTGLTARNLADAADHPDPVFGRGFVGGEGAPHPVLLDLLERRLELKRRSRDLIYSGVIRR